MLQNLKLGLMQFIAKSPSAEDIEIKYTADTSDNIAQKKSDAWNYWQFSMGASGFFDGNQNYKNSNVSAFINASRETEKNRFNLYANNQFNRSSFTIYYKDGNGIDTSEVVNVSRDSQNIEYNYAQKLFDHWTDDGSTEAKQTSRIMHRRVRETPGQPALRMWFETGRQDEQDDRDRDGP